MLVDFKAILEGLLVLVGAVVDRLTDGALQLDEVVL